MGIALCLGMLMAVANESALAERPHALPSDEPATQLEARARAGERAATEQLLRMHAPMLLSVCQHIVGQADARDALQEALEKVVRQLAHFDPRAGTFRSWASAVTRNVCRDRLRRRGLERAAFAHDGDAQTESAHSLAPDPERSAMARQGTSALAQALSELPEEMRTALVMFHVHEATYEEIARALEVPLGTVMTWLHRGRQRLRAKVEEP